MNQYTLIQFISFKPNLDSIKLFEAVLKWANAECGRQNIEITPENQTA